MLTYLLGKTIGKMPLFVSLPVDHQLEVQPMLKPMVREAKEMIFTKNTPGLSLFFLIKGRLAARGDLGFEFFEISQPGAAFGEHALMRSKAMHTTLAKTRCELFAISLEDLFKLTVKLGHIERDAMAEILYNDYTKRLRHTATMMRFRFNVAKTETLRKLGSPSADTEALRLQTRWMQKRAVAATHTASKFDALLPRLYLDMFSPPDIDFKAAGQGGKPSPRATTPRSGSRLQALDKQRRKVGTSRVAQYNQLR